MTTKIAMVLVLVATCVAIWPSADELAPELEGSFALRRKEGGHYDS
jgi:hypothetical protein